MWINKMPVIMEHKLVTVLAEDDPNDAFLVKRAFKKVGIPMPVHVCCDGEDARHYLAGVGRYADRDLFPFPRVLITDIKMPKVSGLELLEWLQLHPQCKLIPVIMLSSSNNAADVTRAYQAGANCYFMKPNSFEELCDLVKLAFEFWTKCEIPPLPARCA